jgi:glutamate decarboxylase
VAFTFSDDFKKDYPELDEDTISHLLRAKQYIVPSKQTFFHVAYRCIGLLTWPGYPLPPNEEKTKILRVVVRESLSLDMIDRLVSDLCTITEAAMKTKGIDLAILQPGAQSVEKEHSSAGLKSSHKHKARRPMHEGVHRSVC